MSHDLTYLKDILNSAQTASYYLKNISIADFLNNGILQDAVIRRIELIGEASGRVSEEYQKKNSELPWREMKGMRNLLIHEYDAINLEEVYNTVKTELPKLIQQIKSILE